VHRLDRKLPVIGLTSLSARRRPKTIAISAKRKGDRSASGKNARNKLYDSPQKQKGRREAGVFSLI